MYDNFAISALCDLLNDSNLCDNGMFGALVPRHLPVARLHWNIIRRYPKNTFGQCSVLSKRANTIYFRDSSKKQFCYEITNHSCAETHGGYGTQLIGMAKNLGHVDTQMTITGNHSAPRHIQKENPKISHTANVPNPHGSKSDISKPLAAL